jgi:uncharacterized protein
MAAGPSSYVDCAQSADDAAVLERDYPLKELPRLRDLLADTQGSVHARFAFSKAASGRAVAQVKVEAAPQLICQRCLRSFAYAVRGGSEVEFSEGSGGDAAESPRETYAMQDGRVSLRELAEEELLLALPIVAMHPPHSCARAPLFDASAADGDAAGERSRPFAGLQDLFKRT